MAWMDNIKTWTGLSVEESVRMTEDRDKWRKYVHGMAVATAKEHNRTLCLDKNVHRSLTQSIINRRTESGRNGRRKLASHSLRWNSAIADLKIWCSDFTATVCASKRQKQNARRALAGLCTHF